jgi:aerobic-type carbon monoxide dehydrogenase small subunit (CoxS/CutS family)
MSTTVDIDLLVNGKRHQSRVPARLLLADYLREQLNLTGTHLGCEQGICGTCTVVVDGSPARSCLMLAAQADGCTITTIEGVSLDGELTPVQQAFNNNHAMQCGFCTSGFIISLHHLLSADPNATDEEMMAVLGGHLCRCTGYQNIIAAAREARSAAQAANPNE